MKEVSGGVEDVVNPERSSPSLWGDEIFTDEVSAVDSSSQVYSNVSEHITENGSADAHSDDGSVKSPCGSPGRSAFDSPQNFHSPSHDVSPHARDSYRYCCCISSFSFRDTFFNALLQVHL